MTHPVPARTRKLTVIAQDPSIRHQGRILRAEVDIRAEELADGPKGHRAHVVDYDATTGSLIKPLPGRRYGADGACVDPFAGASDRTLLTDPQFHAQNVYAIVMQTLARFEFALGRRVSWGFETHQIKIAPHAFADANAFYSPGDEALVFGYFPARSGGHVFSALSHDVVAHETTHALLDGLRCRFLEPSSPDQAAFHEGFADVVALLSVFSLPRIAEILVDYNESRRPASSTRGNRQIQLSSITEDSLKQSMLFALADQMGEEMSGVRGQPLRHSAGLKASPEYYNNPFRYPDYLEAHQRGEILVAAMLDAFVYVWVARLRALGKLAPGMADRSRVIEEGAAAADYLLTMAIRALDYTPPNHLLFGDFLSALLTADLEIRPDDSRYKFRQHLRDAFQRFGIRPASKRPAREPGAWAPVSQRFSLDRVRFEALLRDPDEVFGFIWENRKALGISETAYGKVLSVRPSLRIAPEDGAPLRETVAEFYQVLKISAAELPAYKLRRPKGMPDDTIVSLYGGNTLVFDEFGRLKYNIGNSLDNTRRQQARLNYLWHYGFFDSSAGAAHSIAAIHLRRGMRDSLQSRKEAW